MQISDERLKQLLDLAKDGVFALNPSEDADCAAALEELQQRRRQADRWVPVSERLPEGDLVQTHLVLDDAYANCQAQWFGGRDWRVDVPRRDKKDLPRLPNVTHWRPLPAPPESLPSAPEEQHG